MKKILVVLTGGTIGSRVEGAGVDVSDTSPYRLLHLYREVYGGDGEFQVVHPLNLLSENMTPKRWGALCQVMWELDYGQYEGVIVAHGSDTLSYTSALLGMFLRHVPVPVVLTASNYPLGEKGSNGLVNFRSAVELIRTRLLKGVFTLYQNDKGENNVYLATRVTEADPYLDQFGSFGGAVFGKMEKGNFLWNDHRINPSLLEISEEKSKIAENCPCFEKPVLMIRPYPGLDYESINLDRHPAAVLHYLYHSATACTAGEGHSAAAFIRRCQKRRIPVYMASCKNASGRNYVTAKALMDEGAVPMENISPEAAYAKLMLLYNMETKNREKLMEKTIYYENIIKK